VENDAKLITELREAFARQGYEVDTASDGVQGLERLMKGVPGLIIADYIMPRMKGIEFIRVVRNTPQFAEIPIIVLSEKDDQDFRSEALRVGASRFILKKSATPALVAAHVNALLRRLPPDPAHAPPAPPPIPPEPPLVLPTNVPTEAGVPSGTLPEVKGLEPAEMERFDEGREYFVSGKYYEAYEIWKDLETTNQTNQDLKMWLGIARQNVRKVAFKLLGSKEHIVRIIRDLASFQRLSPEEGIALSRLRSGITVDDAIKSTGWDSMKALYVLAGLHSKSALKTEFPVKDKQTKDH